MEDSLLQKPRSSRRWSDMFKDGQSNGPPTLFRHTSMQKLRHCCQNLGLFPYLLHTLGNTDQSKLNLNILLTRITEKIFLLYTNQRQKILSQFSTQNRDLSSQKTSKIIDSETRIREKFNFSLEKPKKNNFFITIAVYIAFIVLAFEVIFIATIMNYTKYTPGFLFLFLSLLLLAYVCLSVFLHRKTSAIRKRSKKKIE